jgi:outer membrane protein insertion porin family
MQKKRWLLLMITLLAVGLAKQARAEVIKKILIEGNRAIEEETIRSYLLSKEGDEFSPEMVTKDIKAIYSSGFVSDVQVDKTWHGDGPGSGVVLTYRIVEKPIVDEIKFEGNNKLKKEDLETAVSIKSHSIYDRSKVKEAEQIIMNEYNKKGMFLTEVSSRLEPAEEKGVLRSGYVDVVFEVVEYKKPTVQQVEFFGNENLKDRDLGRVMKTRQDSAMFVSGKYLREDFLQDLYNLSYYYQDNGYLESKFEEPERFLTPDLRHVIISISVEEGLQYRVGLIRVKGDLLAEEDEFKENFELKEGEIFRKSLLVKDIQYLTDFYGDFGYALVNIDEDLDLDREGQLVNITYDISKGRKVYLEEIKVTGNRRTYDKVIRRELTFSEGQLFSTRQMRKSQSRVKRLGFFSDIQFVPRPAEEEDTMNLEIAVKEKPFGTLSAGAGYSSLERFFFNAQYQQYNFLGLGQSLSFMVQAGGLTENYFVEFKDPYFLDSPWYMGVYLFATEKRFLDFVRESTGAQLTLGRRLPHTEYTRLFLTYAYKGSSLEGYEDRYSIYRRQPDPSLTGSMKLRIQRNALDNVLDPTEGTYLAPSVEVAGHGIFGGENDFVKTEIDGRYLRHLFKNTYCHIHGEMGYLDFADDEELLITERYFLGGIHSLRGFEYGSVSPRFEDDSGDLIRIGGNKMMYYNFEYIIPISKQMGFKLVLFYDMGNVYNDNEGMDFRDMRHDYGFGIRWMSPMGPLRFEMGYPLDPEKDEEMQVFNFAIGTIY